MGSPGRDQVPLVFCSLLFIPFGSHKTSLLGLGMQLPEGRLFSSQKYHISKSKMLTILSQIIPEKIRLNGSLN